MDGVALWQRFRQLGQSCCGRSLLIVAAVFGSACSGKERPFADTVATPPEGTAGGAATGNESNPEVAAEANDDPAASIPAAVMGGGGICDADGNCECDESNESCVPIALCADGGSACDATCSGCLIEGQCVAPQSIDPANPCQICDPARAAGSWSSNDGTSCDDGLFCTTEDACAEGQCTGAVRVCDDAVACNGVSACDEALDACTVPVNQCPAGTVCDVASDSCTSTCAGCLIEGVCLSAGAERPGDPCFICDPAQSTTAYSIAAGKSCGALPTPCSLQDSCDAAGVCQPNHVPAETACGTPGASACDQPDSCDGAGNCLTRTAANESPCDDGSFCTVGDQCQGGQCVATGNRNCGAGLACNEAVDQCQCQGCVVGTQCFAAGAVNGANACDICDPARSATAFSANAGANCGSGPTECSAQDTCNAQRQCVPNNLPVGSACSSVAGGQCEAEGRCSDRLAGRPPLQESDFEQGTLGFAMAGPDGSIGTAMAAGGDINGDGIDDLVLGAPSASAMAGQAFAVFGRRGSQAPSLADVSAGLGGFVITGAAASDRLGVDAAIAGDVNGDGLADIIVGAAGFLGAARFGAAYVVFGKSDTAPVSVEDIAAGQGGGFVIPGNATGDLLGNSVAGAGDVNSDGFGDVVVSTVGARPGARVVFGKQDFLPVDTEQLSRGFSILAAAEGDGFFAVEGANDVNADGFDDVLVGQPSANVGNLSEAGRVYVIFGRAGNSSVALADIDSGLPGGFVINGSRADDRAGPAAVVGDINADGLNDLLVGANRAVSNGNEGAGKAYLVFGQATTTPVQLLNVEAGAGGFVMNGVGAEDGTGVAVANAGDVNADGINDLLVAAPTASRGGVAFSGTVYVVFGKVDTTPVALNTLLLGDRGGFAVDVQGFSVASADFNDDGASDLIFNTGPNIYFLLGQP